MPVLPYCILLNASNLPIPSSGVNQSEIRELREGELLALYSELEPDQISASNFKSSALEFHNVVHAVFAQAAVVPFRFPTWLSLPEFTTHLQVESSQYKTFLRTHADHVQMELRIMARSNEASGESPTSGTEHLRQRARRSRELTESAKRIRQILSAHVREWREREVRDGLRLYALLCRQQVAALRETLSRQVTETGLRWSGPWPATEFLPEIRQR